MNWSEASEVVVGLILKNKVFTTQVRPELFIPPYDNLVRLLKSGETQIEKLIEKVGLSPVQASIEAAKRVNGLGDSDWVQILENTALYYDAGNKMERLGRKLQMGESIDWSIISSIAHNAQSGIGGEFVPLSDIEPGEIPFKLTGFKALDVHFGGLPEVGQVVVAAPPGTGKTTFMVGLAGCYATKHPTEQVAIFTLEMMKQEIAMRFQEVTALSTDARNRIQINDAVLMPEEVISKAASFDNLGLVCIDFADLLIKGETTESTMAHIYRTFMLGAKQLGCPIVLLSQLNRGYTGGIPRPTDIRYTGLAEALAWMILMLYNPNSDFFGEEESDTLPMIGGNAYIICWKIRGGFRMHPDDSPGAILVPFKGSLGWRTDHSGKWKSLKKL
jgi:hypothetical protein